MVPLFISIFHLRYHCLVDARLETRTGMKLTTRPLLIALGLALAVLFQRLSVSAFEYEGLTDPPPCPKGFVCDLSSRYTRINATTPTAAVALRKKVIDYIWKGRGFPTRFPDEVLLLFYF